MDSGQILILRHSGASVSWRTRRLKRTPRPSEIRSVEADQVLWLPDVTRALRERLDRLGAAWVSDSGDLHLPTPWGLVSYDASRHSHSNSDDYSHADSDDAKSAARLSPGALATLQFLLEYPEPASQHRVAAAVGLSQPRVSQVLKELRGDELVDRVAGGWRVLRPERALDVWFSAPVVPTALTVTWYSLAAAGEQIANIWDQAEAEGAEVRLCGDWAADLLAPWRKPGLITVHTDRTLDLEDQNFVPASAETGTVALHVGPIRTDWQPDPDVVVAMTGGERLRPIAPVTEIAREILATGGSDAHQAADELTFAWLRTRAAVVSGRNR